MNTTKHPNIIDVEQAEFQTEVIQRSHELPVVVDFWAPWCGPCRMLGPVLERLAAEPDSHFILAKINVDHNQHISAQYGIRSIPAVKAFVNGRVADEFIGAQPEPMVRQFIQRLPATNGDAAPDPNDPAVRLAEARELLQKGKGEEAQAKLKEFPAGPQYDSAQKLLPLAQFLSNPGQEFRNGNEEMADLWQQAAAAAGSGEHAAALTHLLAIMRHDKSRQQPKNVMLGIFELLGDEDSLTQTYRQQLASVLF